MKPIDKLFARWLAALLLAALALPALADPPARVGRLAETAGQVWIYDEAEGEWVDASRNRPVTTGDRLSTDTDSRAAVQVGSIGFRLDADSEVEVLQLDDGAVRLHLHRGALALLTRSAEAAREAEVVTDEGRFSPARAGHVRVERDGDVSTATVWSGSLHFTSEDSELDVDAGQRVEFWRDDDRTHYTRLQPTSDSFSEWALAAESRENAERSAASRYVSPEIPGVEDLDRHGRWESSEDYGHLWVPYGVAPGWAPYRHGQWAWVRPWGWSWVDAAPWGYAPFHYGRWVHHRNRWCWAPGPYHARPVYAPALVAWIGGPRASVSVNIGSRPPAVGWFPLGPREIYVPSYRSSPNYFRSINGSHVRTIDHQIVRQPTMATQHNRYVNRTAPNALTVVEPDVIRRRQPVPARIDPLLVRELDSAPVSVALPVAAALASRRAAGPNAGPPRTPIVPPPEHRNRIDSRIVRQPGERPVVPRGVVPPAAIAAPTPPTAGVPQPRAALPAPSRRAYVETPRERIVAPRAVDPRAVAPQAPAMRQHVQPPPGQRVFVAPPRAPAVVPPAITAPPPQAMPMPRAAAPAMAAPPAAVAAPVAPQGRVMRAPNERNGNGNGGGARNYPQRER